MPEIRVAARRLKVSTALDPAPIARAPDRDRATGSRTMLTIEVAGGSLRADIAHLKQPPEGVHHDGQRPTRRSM